MNASLLERLACPLCGGSLSLADGDLTDGLLECDRGHERWQIRHGVPRLVPPDLSSLEERTANAFGAEWTYFTEQHPEFERQFLDWIHPIKPEFFADKDVLDAGCGTGRHSRLAASYGARSLVALDLSSAVDTASRVLETFDNVGVVQGDLLRPPFRGPEERGGFDLVYSIGVLHHLPDPRAGFLSLARQLRPGGRIAVWVYGYENNGVVRHVVEPLRVVTTRTPHTALRAVSWPLAVAFHGTAKGIYAPLVRRGRGRKLPLREYLASVAGFSFRQNYAIVYDQLVAPSAAYIRGGELRGWFDDAGLENIEITRRQGNSWRGQGSAPAP